MSNQILVTCFVASTRRMYGKRAGQTQIKFKFESEGSLTVLAIIWEYTFTISLLSSRSLFTKEFE